MSANLIERLRDQRLLEAHRTTAADTVAERTSAGYREQLLFDAINALAAKDTALSEMAERVHYAEGTAIANIARANEAEAALSEMRAELERAREALKPFATGWRVARAAARQTGRVLQDGKAMQSGFAWRDTDGNAKTITWGDFRAAARALASQDEGEER